MILESGSTPEQAAQEPKPRRNGRLLTIAAAVVVMVAAITAIVYFAVHEDSPPKITDLVIEDLVVGTGEEVQTGDTVSVHYTLWLDDGREVQSSVDGQPFRFTLGTGNVIKGWDHGIVGMKVGGRRKLIIPPDLAYGAAGIGNVIPPNATLQFEVQLLAVE